MMDRRRFLRGTVGVAGAVVLGGCNGTDDASSGPGSSLLPAEGPAGLEPVPRPTLRLPGGDFGFPSPFTYSRGPGYWRMSYLYDTLLWKDSTGDLLPWLASGFERSEDGLTYTFGLRDDVRFEVRLTRPVVTFLRSVAGALPIVPRHIWASVDDAAAASDLAVLVGTGPYRLQTYSQGEGAYLFTANDDHFLGMPFVERIEYQPVGDELTALMAGEIDAGGPPPLGGARPEALAPFGNDASFGVLDGPADATSALYFNLAAGGALADVRFRRACAMALDRDDLVERLLGGNGEPGNPGFLPPSHPSHHDVEQYPFDVEAANALLDDAGYARDGTGIRQGTDRRPLRFSLLVGNQAPSPVAELLVGVFGVIGVELNPEGADPPTRDARTAAGDYDIALIGYGGLGGDPDYLREVYSSRVPRRFQSVSGYTNAEFDEIADQQLVALDDDERAQLVDRMQEIVAADVPLLPLFYPTSFHIFRESVFDQWYFTPGGFANRIPTVYNKQVFITGLQTGTEVRPFEE
ncbi:MAG: ABC transporter substrate-binding protein [Chloroflexi bacterium]|nr:ABC transporter substrate-binding protein [Chloroflexota bacterium]